MTDTPTQFYRDMTLEALAQNPMRKFSIDELDAITGPHEDLAKDTRDRIVGETWRKARSTRQPGWLYVHREVVGSEKGHGWKHVYWFDSNSKRKPDRTKPKPRRRATSIVESTVVATSTSMNDNEWPAPDISLPLITDNGVFIVYEGALHRLVRV